MELMGFIDENEIDFRPLAARERLYRAHLDRLIAIGALVDTLHDADGVDVLGLECRDGLIDQAECGNHEGRALSLVERALDDMHRRQGLAEAGRR